MHSSLAASSISGVMLRAATSVAYASHWHLRVACDLNDLDDQNEALRHMTEICDPSPTASCTIIAPLFAYLSAFSAIYPISVLSTIVDALLSYCLLGLC